MAKDGADKSGSIDIKKYNQGGREDKVFKLTLSSETTPDVHPILYFSRVTKFNVKGRVEVGSGFWTTLVLTGDLTNRKSIPFNLELKSSSPDLNILKLAATVNPASSNSGIGRLSVDIKYNQHTLNYVSKIAIKNNSIKAQSTLKTNIRQL